ncbi:MAG: NUDIX domain-containing protein [Bacteroidota bacterium]|nr:NUDIX domain-containing protein [Bacteroidota bacterium]
MPQNYKIFINNIQIIIVNFNEPISLKDAQKIKQENLSKTIFQITSGVYTGKNIIIVQTEDSKILFNAQKKHFKVIKAAGGIVFNDKGQLLLIKRLGKWDLPKGKIEKGENTKLAALREVHEECGLHFLGLVSKNTTTYHAYFLKGQWILKQTHWFNMIAWDDKNLVPQTEEDITEVRWVNKDFLLKKDFETYDTLKPIFESLKF